MEWIKTFMNKKLKKITTPGYIAFINFSKINFISVKGKNIEIFFNNSTVSCKYTIGETEEDALEFLKENGLI